MGQVNFTAKRQEDKSAKWPEINFTFADSAPLSYTANNVLTLEGILDAVVPIVKNNTKLTTNQELKFKNELRKTLEVWERIDANIRGRNG